MDQIRKSLVIGRRIACKILTEDKEWLADVQKWASEHEANHRAMGNLADKEKLHESIRRYNDIDVEKGFEQAMRKLGLRKQRRIIFRITSVAALAALFVSSFLFLFERPMNNNKGEKLVEDTFAVKHPELILADGKRVVLENRNFEMLSEQGTTIHQDSSYKLVYIQDRGTSQDKQLFHVLNIPVGTDYFVQLCDGTKIWLNSFTTLKYPVEFVGKERRVYLDGEAYFDVAKDSEHPFIVVVRGVEVVVYGTRFNVNTRTEGRIRTVLESGSVAIRAKKSQEIFLKPNQLGDCDEISGECQVLNVNIAKYIGWKSGEYYFENERLEDIMNELALWYDVKFFYSNSSVKDLRITCCLPKYKEISDLLSVLESASDIHFKISGRAITVR